MRHFHLEVPGVKIELGPSGALAASLRGDVIVVVDAIRASAKIVTALANGIVGVKPVVSVDSCVGEVTAGERGGKKLAGLNPDASVLIGAMLNATAVAKYALSEAQRKGSQISVVIAGRNNQPVIEDIFAASEIALSIPGANLTSEIDLQTSEDPVGDFLASESGQNLIRLKRTSDVIWCAQKNIYDVVPVYDGQWLVSASQVDQK